MDKPIKKLTRDDLEHFGSIITIKDTDECLGGLWHVPGIRDEKGEEHKDVTFDPSYGQVPVSKEEAEAHNKAFDQARVEGLDNQCQVGQGGHFYLTRPEGRWQVATFVGTVIAEKENIIVNGLRVTVKRKGRTFKGHRNTQDACIFLKRTK